MWFVGFVVAMGLKPQAISNHQLLQGGPLCKNMLITPISRVIIPVSRVITQGKPIYKAIYRGPNSVMFLTIAGAHLKRQLWGFTPLEDSENRFMLLKKSEKGTLEWWSLELSIIILLFQGTSKILLSDDNTHQNGQLFFLNLWRIHYIHRSIIPFVREEQQSSNGSLNLNRRISLGGWRRKLTRNASYDGKSHVFSKLSK